MVRPKWSALPGRVILRGRFGSYKAVLYSVLMVLPLIGCAIGDHSTFVPSTYVDHDRYHSPRELGKVSGENCQLRVLYLFPVGEAPSTDEALSDAMDDFQDTVFLTDMAVEARMRINVFFLHDCIEVTGTAQAAELRDDVE